MRSVGSLVSAVRALDASAERVAEAAGVLEVTTGALVSASAKLVDAGAAALRSPVADRSSAVPGTTDFARPWSPRRDRETS